MARGTARAPSHDAYRGAIGQTQTETVHVTGTRGELIAALAYTTIDAVSDPELVQRLHAGTLNTVKLDGAAALPIPVPVVYHDPAAEVMVLVLSDAHRHREIDERIRLLERMRADDAAIPAYVKEFGVVFGSAGLRAYLEERATQVLTNARAQETAKELERRRGELAASEGELAQARSALAAAKAALAREQAELERQREELDRMRAEARARVLAAAQAAEPAPPVPTPAVEPAGAAPAARPRTGTGEHDGETRPIERPSLDDLETASQPALAPAASAAGVEVDDEPTGMQDPPVGGDPLTTETVDLAHDRDAIAANVSGVRLDADGRVRLVIVAGERLARGLTADLDLRVLLHRATTYAVVTLVVGTPAALRAPHRTKLVVLPLDVSAESERAVLAALARKFELTVDIAVDGEVMRRVLVTAPLAENVAYILRAADDHLRGINADGESEPSFAQARELVLGAGYDLLGADHAEAGEFRDDKLAQVDTAQHVRRALGVARRFARPSREDYLVCARGYPLVRWRKLRRQALERAVAWGLWMGPELAQVAVSEGLARSRRDLIVKLDAGFEALRKDAAAYDLDADAAEDNVQALAEEAKALGVELRRKVNGAIKSEDVQVVSGSIERTPTAGVAKVQSADELIALLDDKKHRVNAASDLCDRGEGRAAEAVLAAVRKMSRAEAVRILGKVVKLGPPAAGPLMEGLSSSKAFLRHGCALALALLRTDEGTHAVIDLLLAEPTEIWREVARAVGQIGPTALMPLAAHVGRLGGAMTPAVAERVAWAMAHIGVRGGKAALEQMAAGQSVMAPIAQHALGLHGNAARDEVRVRPGVEARDVTVNRAFSRRFFEALEADRPDEAQAALHDMEASGPLELLDEADLIVDEDDEAELDESDLIQT
jgi:hypothetical protein